MPWGNVAFDADLAAQVVGDLAGAAALHARDVERGKAGAGHNGHDRGLCQGYAVRRSGVGAAKLNTSAGWPSRVPGVGDG
jgi:hypothetical protein